MLEKIKAVNNPLTTIAIFAALAEVAGTVALKLVSQDLQFTFLWFVMLFPVLLVLLFFATLNFNTKVLYAPSDFKNDENFLNAIRGVHNLSLNLDEVQIQLESAKSHIIEDAVKQISIVSAKERARLEQIVNLRIEPVQEIVETTREVLSQYQYPTMRVPEEKPSTVARYIAAKLPSGTFLADDMLLEIARMLIRDEKANAISKLCEETKLDQSVANGILTQVNVVRLKDEYLRADRGESN